MNRHSEMREGNCPEGDWRPNMKEPGARSQEPGVRSQERAARSEHR
jgi:hypothetical protein